MQYFSTLLSKPPLNLVNRPYTDLLKNSFFEDCPLNWSVIGQSKVPLKVPNLCQSVPIGGFGLEVLILLVPE